MKTKRWVLMCAVIYLASLLISGFFTVLQPPRAQAASLGDALYAPDHIIIKLKQEPLKAFSASSTGYASLDSLMRHYGASAALLYDSPLGNQALKKSLGLTRTYVLKLSDGVRVDEAVAAFSLDPQVEYAEPDYIGYGAMTPNDSYYAGDQWALNNTRQFGGAVDADIDAPQAWDVTTGSSSTIIAVIDTGLDLDNPEFPVDKRVAGWDFVNNDAVAQDDHGHGTHVAGIAAAKTNDATGVAGVCWGCRVMPLKALDHTGWGTYVNWAASIYYAVDHGADVINMSLGGTTYGYSLHDAVKYAYNVQVPIVAGMGNDGDTDNYVYYPAGYAETIAVGSTDHYDARSDFSCYGSHIDLVAPGSYILGPWFDNLYYYASGTSMAAPHVSGVLGLIESLKSDYTVEQLRTILRDTADDLGTAGWDQYFGAGRLNAYQALSYMIPGSINLTASKYGMQSMPYKASALINPDTAVLPLTFLWEAEGQTTVTHTVDLDDWITYTWSVTGTYWITANVWNAYGAVTAAKQVTILAPIPNAKNVFLPLVMRP